MDALIAIATLCQIASAQPSMSRVDAYQLKCQKELITCYFKKPTQETREERQKLLKDCILERVVKTTCP